MTIQGAIAELQNLINADDVPHYYNGCIEKVIETILIDLPTIEVSEDAISRKGIKIRLGKRFSGDPRRIMEIVKETVDDAPSVVPSYQKNRQVERVEGEWIVKQSGFAECSVCEQQYFSDYNYCPNCGAKMRDDNVEDD